ncbi:TonB-dependent receptor domain-containing protein [Glaciecola sp. MH2013]|uniref:TonB-dependent receptor family protein n=1 Tax=Glaciecola sp. MH2013 TaxID=2785524 RepID=UPI001E51B926|nr:TonB-dependent receptor [Glaciecola sp. MH2013]
MAIASSNTKYMCTIAASVLATLSISKGVLAEEKTNDKIEVIQIFGSKNDLKTATGSGAVLTEEQLELYEFDDIHRVLQSVPGVYIREEDGYGLRPNIGLRGATSERSSKIALMEDGVLLSPAPYSAPAAYFFPLVSRMTAVEVFKGPAAIKYGPNTVGGAINMVSRPINESQSPSKGQIDFSAGQQDYRKLHAYYSDTLEHLGDDIGYLVEGINLHTDGFKTLASGDSTGFAKNELLGKLSYSPKNSRYNQYYELKVGYADEVSNETYLGLSDADFKQNPYLRYPASANDKFDWEHFQIQLSHYAELSPNLTLFTQAYRRDFNRDWDRLNGFAGNRSIETVLRSPDTGLNALFFQVLNGERDSLTNDEALEFTLNDRTFFSQGIQSKLFYDLQVNNFDVSLEAGFRIHQDQVERLHRARYFNMVNAELVFSGRPEVVLLSNKDKTTAIASYIDAKLQADMLTLNAGLRAEHIEGQANDFLSESTLTTTANNSDTVVLPGIGAFYQINDTFGLLAGVNKGFVPNSPGQNDDIDPEESWNYELGARASGNNWNAEAIAFYFDYSNLKGTCTFSSGCTSDLNQEFNGGEVIIQGVEFSANADLDLSKTLSVPLSLAYTFTESEFQNDFRSEFSQWGNISAGDELPYLPENQLNIQVGLQAQHWQVAMNIKHSSEMLEAAGSGTDLSGLSTESLLQIDVSGWYQIQAATRIYIKIDNLSDETQIVSRRPFGARPGKPQQLIVGIKYEF